MKIFKAVVAVFIIISVLFTYILVKNYKKSAEQYCNNNIKNELTQLVNKTFFLYAKENSYISENILEFQYNNGKISSVSVNSALLNICVSELITAVSHSLNNLNDQSFNIPFGNLFGISFLSGIGFGVPIKIVPLGSIAGDTKTDFTSVGINQTMLSIKAEFRISYQALFPFQTCYGDIGVEYLLLETMIIGDVPHFFLNTQADVQPQKTK